MNLASTKPVVQASAEAAKAAPVRTRLEPGDLNPFIAHLRTAMRPEDWTGRKETTRTALEAGEATGQNHRITKIRPGDLEGRLAPEKSDEQVHKELTQNAQKLVSQTFFGTLLKQMHDSPFKSDVLSGGKGAQAFNPMLDQHLAERMARASGRRLADSIVKHIERARRKGGGKGQSLQWQGGKKA